jgi:RNA polymerase sigma-70 factor (ECF subfamily)
MQRGEIERVIAQVLSGEYDAYGQLVRAYQQDVGKVVAALLRSTRETEDLVQMTFIEAFRHLDRFDTERDFGHWIKGIARNLIREELRSRAREHRRLELYRHHLLAVLDNPTAVAAQERLFEVLAWCEEELAPSSAKLIDCRYRQGLNCEIIAVQEGRTVAAIRQQFQRIRLALRDCINKHLVLA